MLMSPSQLPLECCSAPAALSPELSLPPVAVETTHQLLLAEIQPALVLLGRHCVTGLPAGGEYVWGVCVGSVWGVCVGSVCGESVWGRGNGKFERSVWECVGVCGECEESVWAVRRECVGSEGECVRGGSVRGQWEPAQC